MTTPNTHAVRQIVEDLREDSKHEIGSHRQLLIQAAEALEQSVTDAERYRFLRGEGPEVSEVWHVAFKDTSITLEVLDRLIDRVLTTQAGTSGKDEK